jgi:2-polyprenyl-3-methyl-5-hydroxy-6-metoxy-1,4-benzoquinol methylase
MKVRTILKCIGDVDGLKCLDIGCGIGFFTNEMSRSGADVIGIDYSISAIEYGKIRYPDLDLRVNSAYELGCFAADSFDVVLLVSVIEHMSDHITLLNGIHRILKPGGRLIVSTDIKNGIWKRPFISPLVLLSLYFSKEGRALKSLLKAKKKNESINSYSISHIALLSYKEFESVVIKNRFEIKQHIVFSFAGVPIRDIPLMLMPTRWRGDYQCIVAKKLPH